MNLLFKLESAASFIFSIAIFSLLPYPWWWYPILFLLPDIGMLGYLVNPRIGAWVYNAFHLVFVAIGLILLGIYIHVPVIELSGVIMLGHIGLDRVLGYGLKYEDSFKHTHLGRL